MARRKKSTDNDDDMAFDLPADEAAGRNDGPPAEPGGNGDPFAPESGSVDAMFGEWFLDYASYVILERAVPHADDGLKPVQRRILHSMREMEDGRFHKVANIIGNSMKYHPHGDVSIGDALVHLGQRGLLVDTQGNWGNVETGDSAAAPRYIEARLSKFALQTVFNPKTTRWQASYDGRNKEPVTLPAKFPLLLAQGAEGIAVGLSCKILPHNFNELADGCVALLKGEQTRILPDFPTGGIADCSDYNGGRRGGRVRVRARIERRKKNLLAITELPFGKTTSTLIDSILAAHERGKFKIQRVEDNTAQGVEILVHLPSGSDAATAEHALYAFTDCETSIAANVCVIENGKPKFLSADDLLYLSTEKTRELLGRELEIRLGELRENWHFSSLEKIFIEERIYRRIEKSETWEAVIQTIDKGLEPYKDRFMREITRDDIVRLTEIKIKRISKYDSLRADERIRGIEDDIRGTQYNLDHLTDYAIEWFEALKRDYGESRGRRTEIASFEKVAAQEVVAANETLYVNRKEGFAGHGMKKDEAVAKCSSLDDVLAITRDGRLVVSRIAEKAFFAKNIAYIDVFNRKAPDATVFCLVYRDGANGPAVAKRFTVGGVTRDKVYDLTKGKANSRVLYLSAYEADSGEPDQVRVNLKPAPRQRKQEAIVDFGQLPLRNRSAGGHIVAKHAVKSVTRLTRAERERARAT